MLPLVPPGVVTVTLRSPSAALASIDKSARTEWSLGATASVTRTSPPPLTAIVVRPATKFVPVSATETLVPRTPSFGVIELSVGGTAAGSVAVSGLQAGTDAASAATNSSRRLGDDRTPLAKWIITAGQE